MTATDPSTLPDAPIDDRPARRAVWILVWAQAVLGAQMPVHFILGALAGQAIAPDPALATLPISMVVLTSMFASPAISLFMGRFGRRPGFLLGAAFGTGGMALAAQAIAAQSWPLFLAASSMIGVYMAGHNLYRFAAADLASEAYRPRAISYVMAGGLAAAVIGPEVVQTFEGWWEPVPFAGAYAAAAILCGVGSIPLLFLRIPRPPRRPRGERQGRPWGRIFADRRVPVAMLCAMIAYAMMNLMMTSTPLAVVACGFATADAAEVVRIHVLAMYAPSFFTGGLIARFGAGRIIALGLALLAAASASALAGITLGHFFVALALLGVGWNFAFIGATTMLADAHLPEERAKVQGLNDFLLFGLVAGASFSSGLLMTGIGWDAVAIALLPFLAIAALALVWLNAWGPGRGPAAA